MSGSTLDILFEVRLPEMAHSKFERERRAFYRLFPSLLASHPGQYVAIHDEQVVDSGADQVEVALRVQRRIGTVAIYVHFVSDGASLTSTSGIVRTPESD